MEIRKHYLFFGLFSIIYASTTGLLKTDEDRRISMSIGGLLIVAGIWGLIVGEILLKLPPSIQEYSNAINGVLIILGVICLSYGFAFL